ncbi:F-box/FBD/LRR-repeat protein at5g53840 [Phtheirospermum japonicum]|uniref:F-box/FBD/LRR-repeat protein at5g53840 n=1 Tax=Phtheirospermum japonicum TaxID=374723 RepID=A0A830CDE3_9LAMI|nr:F-box/FBD/LRR-repeat protein at5g53840 [Phtheirospermum japonicum]
MFSSPSTKINFRPKIQALMGGKSDNIDSKFQLKKCAKGYHHAGDDWLSRLPDAILIGILSSLPLKEAARTSILSSRWENLWKHTLRLDFDAHSALDKIVRHRKDTQIRTVERRKYINWVNKVLRSHKGLALKQVRICFDLDNSSAQNAINHWLQFAFERRVERLELDLSEEGDFGRSRKVCAFPMKNCPLLEHLVVDYALKISNLNICGALALKHLEILDCLHIISLKVSAPKLTSLGVTNPVALLLENVPKLVEKLIEEYCKFPGLPNLKKLEIEYYGRGDESIIGLTSFIRAAPYLEEFVIKISWYKFLWTNRNVKNTIHSPHQHLKMVKFSGYYGRASDVELVMYLVDNCVVLEKIIIDPRYQSSCSHAPLDPDEVDGELTEGNHRSVLVYPDEFDGLDVVQTSRNYAKQQLEGQVPQKSNLVIL